MKNFKNDFIITPSEFNEMIEEVKKIHVYNKTSDDKIDSISSLIDKVVKPLIESMIQDRIFTQNDIVIESKSRDVLVTVDCTNKELTANLGTMEYGQRITVSKVDGGLNNLILISPEETTFWTGDNEIRLTSKYDTVTFMRISDTVIIGV